MYGLLDQAEAEEFIKQNKAGKTGATPTKAAKRPAGGIGSFLRGAATQNPPPLHPALDCTAPGQHSIPPA